MDNQHAVFTKKMKKTHTIFLPQMLEYHSPFLQAAFAGSGYRLAVMSEAKGLKEQALRYISSDFCYPTILIVGQVLKTLRSGQVPADRIAFMEPQAGGACRAGNIYRTIRYTLDRCGYGGIPVLSLNFMGLERQPGFRITPRLLFAAVMAVCCGDLCMSLFHQTKPYERETGAADRVLETVQKRVCAYIRAHACIRETERRKIWRYILECFAKIPLKCEYRKKVGVAGEIYIKYSSLGNHNLERFLDRQGCQCSIGGFINYAIYVMDSARADYMMQSGRHMLRPVFDYVLGGMKSLQKDLYRTVTRYSGFETDAPFDELRAKAEGLIGESCITGDGWLVAAEAADAIEKGCRHILIVHPFGCLVSHVCERGIVKNLRSRYPGIAIQTIEYDYDSSDTLRESRILLGLGE